MCEILFAILASIIVAWFSRQRECRADRGSAEYLSSSQPMMKALARLGGVEPGALPQSMRAMGITELDGVVLEPPADRAADRGASGAPLRVLLMNVAESPEQRLAWFGTDIDGVISKPLRLGSLSSELGD